MSKTNIFEALNQYVMANGGPERHDLLIGVSRLQALTEWTNVLWTDQTVKDCQHEDAHNGECAVCVFKQRLSQVNDMVVTTA